MRHLSLTFALIILWASSCWAMSPAFLAVVTSGGGSAALTELLPRRFVSDATGWSGYNLGTVSWISENIGSWSNSSDSYSGIRSDTFSISSGKSITISFTPSSCSGTTKFYMSIDGGSSALSGSTVQEYTCSGYVSYNFTSGVTSSTARLLFYSGSDSSASGSRIENVSVKTN